MPNITESEFRDLYVNQLLSEPQIAKILDISVKKVIGLRNRFNIPHIFKRERHAALAGAQVPSEAEIRSLHLDHKMTLQEIGEKFGLGGTTIKRMMDTFGIPLLQRTPSLVGQIFGHLTVLSETKGGKRGIIAKIQCLCDCGKTVTVQRNNLTSGATKSCGCAKELPDLTGQVFGNLTVIRKNYQIRVKACASSHFRNEIYWECQCVCGTRIELEHQRLTHASTSDCGCISHPALAIGTQFGRLTIVASNWNEKSWKYTCQCNCGNFVVLGLTSITSGIVSCGCAKKERDANSRSALEQLFYQYQDNAHSRKRDFDLTIEQFKVLTQQPCYYCGLTPSRICHNSHGSYIYNGLDRVDSSKGYLMSNVVPCCWDCNKSKGTKKQQDFIAWVKLIHEPSREPLTDIKNPLQHEHSYWKGYQKLSQQRSLIFQLTPQQFAAISRSSCAYCGQPPSSGKEGRKYTGTDRVDNTLGYVISNVVPSCASCNRAKLNRTLSEFLAWVGRFQTFQKTKPADTNPKGLDSEPGRLLSWWGLDCEETEETEEHIL